MLQSVGLVLAAIPALLVASPSIRAQLLGFLGTGGIEPALIAAIALTVGMSAAMAASVFRPSSKPKVFVSFSYKDKEFVDSLIRELKRKGVNIATAEETIRLGDNIRERVRELIDASTHAIVVVSPHYEESQWIEIELGMLGKRIKIIPILHKTDKIPPELREIRSLRVDDVSEDALREILPALPKLNV